MFKFTYEGQEFQVKFQHVQRELWKQREAKKPKNLRRPLPEIVKGAKAATICTVAKVDENGPTVLVRSSSVCVKEDTFSKRRGRSIALLRAIKGFGLNHKNYDNPIWAAYENCMNRAFLTSMANLEKQRKAES